MCVCFVLYSTPYMCTQHSLLTCASTDSTTFCIGYMTYMLDSLTSTELRYMHVHVHVCKLRNHSFLCIVYGRIFLYPNRQQIFSEMVASTSFCLLPFKFDVATVANSLYKYLYSTRLVIIYGRAFFVCCSLVLSHSIASLPLWWPSPYMA